MYGCETVKFMLERGVIDLDYIETAYEATGTLEPGYFRPILSRFDELARGRAAVHEDLAVRRAKTVFAHAAFHASPTVSGQSTISFRTWGGFSVP